MYCRNPTISLDTVWIATLHSPLPVTLQFLRSLTTSAPWMRIMSTDQSREIARHRTTWIVWIVSCLCCVLFMGAQGWAQVDQGTITGVVQDSSGAVLSGAQVTLTSTDTGLVLQAKTDHSGVYTFSPVKIGNYKVAATSAGFQTTSQEHVHLDVQQRLNVPLTLKIGEASQVLTVTSEIPLLQ